MPAPDADKHPAEKSDPINVLLVEDNPDDADLLEIMLKRDDSSNFRITVKDRLKDALAVLKEEPGAHDIVLLDLTLPDSSGLSTFSALHAAFPDIPVAVLTGLNDSRVARETVRMGAQDYLVKGEVDGPLLSNCIRYAIERKRGDIERRRLAQCIQESQHLESLGVLAAGVAHDFNNMLMGILGNVQLMAIDMPDDSQFRSNLDQIRDLVSRAKHQTDQLLLYAGRSAFTDKTLDINRVMQQALAEITPALPKEISFEYRPAADTVCVKGDMRLLTQLIRNLLSNAREALDQVDRDGTITIATRVEEISSYKYLQTLRLGADMSPGRYAVIEVRDNGCGMDENTLEHVLDPFFTTKFLGRGLGLAAVLGIVRRHHGAIGIKSRLNQGTTVTVLLPLQETPSDEDSAAPAEGQDHAEKATVLLVDDEDAVREVGSKLLERAGYNVLTAEDGAQALELYAAQKDSINVVLLDFTMPGSNGLEICAKMLQLDPTAKILLTSGYSQERAINENNSGVSGFVQKPWDRETMLKKLKAVIKE